MNSQYCVQMVFYIPVRVAEGSGCLKCGNLVAPMVLMLSELVCGYPTIFEDKDDATPYELWV